MKYLTFLLTLFLAACSCTTVHKQVQVASKDMVPEHTGVCMAMHTSNDITFYMPLQGGVCAGIVEIIPDKYYLHYSDGSGQQVSAGEYDAAKVGETRVESIPVCN